MQSKIILAAAQELSVSDLVVATAFDIITNHLWEIAKGSKPAPLSRSCHEVYLVLGEEPMFHDYLLETFGYSILANLKPIKK
ncbi:MAG: hypothetical protein RLZZ292_2050 [Bacteroidota bacterium]|jgi:hypothetical protein